jgi:hypothetical protein
VTHLILRPKKETVAVILDPNHQTVAVSFESQTEKPKATDFEAKSREIVDLGFEAKLKNSCCLSHFCTVQIAYSVI